MTSSTKTPWPLNRRDPIELTEKSTFSAVNCNFNISKRNLTNPKKSLIKPLVQVLVSIQLAGVFSIFSGATTAYADEAFPVSSIEANTLWYVELPSAPTADGTSLSTVQNEKIAFRQAATTAGIKYSERRAFDVLFNGLSISASSEESAKISQLSGVKAIYPVAIIQAPDPIKTESYTSNLIGAIQMTGAYQAQNSLGLTGKGVKVGIIDTGIDIDHPALGGTGSNGTTLFPSARVIAGYDFVGDAFTGNVATIAEDPIPDDCAGHGTHVAGIVGANGDIKGVAPEVSFGAYRIFGCSGYTTGDLEIAAMERALADGMQIVNMSLGAFGGWAESPEAQAASRLVNKGVVVVTSIGNNGDKGLFSAGTPGVGKKVIGVASFENAQLSFSVGGKTYGYNTVPYTRVAPTSGSMLMAKTGSTMTTNDACDSIPSDLTGKAVLIRRGSCLYNTKIYNAQLAGAAAVILYNNEPGALFALATGPYPITIPAVAISGAQGAELDAAIAAGETTLDWTINILVAPEGTGGLLSSFSSAGLTPELALKPNIGAPGGNIYSTYPVEKGGYTTFSGTSMASPHVAGGVALILQANPNIPANDMRARLQNSALPKTWSGDAQSSEIDFVHRQGAGMLNIVGTIEATSRIQPSEIALGESETGPKTVELTLINKSDKSVQYTFSYLDALASGPVGSANVYKLPASVEFNPASLVVEANSTAVFNVTITANANLPDQSLYGGYIVVTPDQGGAELRVPYAGFKGDYQSIQVLKPTATIYGQVPALVNRYGLVSSGPFTMVNYDYPIVLFHVNHPARLIRFEAIDAVTGRSWHRIWESDYIGRDLNPNGYYPLWWDGTTYVARGNNGVQWYNVPNGRYVIKISVLKALGDATNPDHWETWSSPVVEIARP